MLFRFDHHVPDKDTGLLERMKTNTDVLMRQCVTLYMMYAAMYANDDIQGHLPEQMRDFDKTMEDGMSPLTAFIHSGSYELHANCFMPMQDFKDEFIKYRRDNGHPAAPW